MPGNLGHDAGQPVQVKTCFASGQVQVPTTEVARNELMPRPAANAKGSLAITPNRIVISPAQNRQNREN